MAMGPAPVDQEMIGKFDQYRWDMTPVELRPALLVEWSRGGLLRGILESAAPALLAEMESLMTAMMEEPAT